MRGPFGMLLVGGGIILIVGLFSGKITFPVTGGGGGGNPLQAVQNFVINLPTLGIGIPPVIEGHKVVNKPGAAPGTVVQPGSGHSCPPGYYFDGTNCTILNA